MPEFKTLLPTEVWRTGVWAGLRRRTSISFLEEGRRLFERCSNGGASSSSPAPASGGACAVGIVAAPIQTGPAGEPVWPPDMVGSIIHFRDMRPPPPLSASGLSVGIDAEPNVPLP